MIAVIADTRVDTRGAKAGVDRYIGRADRRDLPGEEQVARLLIMRGEQRATGALVSIDSCPDSPCVHAKP